jgi:hypothetical protein
MKKQILTIVLITALIGSITTSCSSKKKTSEAKKNTTAPADTMKKDTVKH